MIFWGYMKSVTTKHETPYQTPDTIRKLETPLLTSGDIGQHYMGSAREKRKKKRKGNIYKYIYIYIERETEKETEREEGIT